MDLQNVLGRIQWKFVTRQLPRLSLPRCGSNHANTIGNLSLTLLTDFSAVGTSNRLDTNSSMC